MKERRELINKIIEDLSSVTLKELEDKFPDISTMTIRRDLEFLEKRGDIIRTKSGAMSIKAIKNGDSSNREAAYTDREAANFYGKQKIAVKAIPYIEEGRSVFLDSGTTVMELARRISSLRLSAITCDPNIALELANNSVSSVTIVGGQLNRENLSLSGVQAIDFITSINIDLAIMASSGFFSETGFTCGNAAECELKRLVISKARKVIMLMDKTKLDRTLPYTFAVPNDIDVFICDEEIQKISENTETIFAK